MPDSFDDQADSIIDRRFHATKARIPDGNTDNDGSVVRSDSGTTEGSEPETGVK